MNPQSKNIFVMIIASLSIFAAAFWYSENVEKNIHYPVESGRLPVENSKTFSGENVKLTALK